MPMYPRALLCVFVFSIPVYVDEGNRDVPAVFSLILCYYRR